MQLLPGIFSYLPFDYRVQYGIYSYIHRYFTLLTIWTSTYIEKFFLKFLNIIDVFPFCCMIIDDEKKKTITKLVNLSAILFPTLNDQQLIKEILISIGSLKRMHYKV